jgi:predicted ATP-dependent endonuclease of OLD family
MPELISLHRFLTTRGFSNDDFNLFSVLSTIYNSGYIRTSNVRCLSHPVLFHDDARSLKIRTYGEITGKEIPTILFHLKNSDDPLKRKRYNEIQKEFRSMTNMEFDVILRAVESNRAINMSSLPSSELSEIMSNKVAHSDNQDASSLKNALFEIAIYVIKNQILIPMDLVAAGLFEALYFTTTIINQTQKVILLDEPAVNLHPNWQRRILEIINKTISSGQNQVILITHSPFLVNQGLLESTWRLDNHDNKTVILR